MNSLLIFIVLDRSEKKTILGRIAATIMNLNVPCLSEYPTQLREVGLFLGNTSSASQRH
jgi:hypothetical protein